jgi:beta-phosphoglucomutase
MIKAVLFDMDGVLIEAKEWHYEALNKALRVFGYEISRHAHLTTYDGLPTKTKLNMLSVEQALPEALHPFINELKQLYTMEMVYTLCKPRFHHEFALASLNASGYQLACCSNSIRPTIEAMLGKANLIGYLEFFMSAQDVAQPKPAPDMYLEAMARLGLHPEEVLILEDNENGIKAAKDSGAHVLVIKDVAEVNLDNIKAAIEKANAANIKAAA